MLKAQSSYEAIFGKEAQVAVGGVFESFLNNLKILREQLNPQIKLVNQVAQHENALKQLINSTYTGKINPATRQALERRLQQLNQVIQPLVASESQDSTKLQKLQQDITRFLTNAFQSQAQPVAQTAAKPAAPNAQSVQSAPTTPPMSGAGVAGKLLGKGVKWPARTVGKAWQGVKNVARDFGQGFSQAESDKIILTGSMSSAEKLFKQ